MNCMENKVSIIVPIFNAAPYLADCIKSILAQTYSNIELILIDDGSTDGSSEICDSFALNDKRIFCQHTKNRGVSASRNLGIDMSSGKWIIFYDADDTVPLDSLNKLVEAILDTDYDMVMGNYQFIKLDGSIITSCSYDCNSTLSNDEAIKLFFRYKYERMQGYIWNRLFRLDAIKESGIRFNEKIYYKEDGLFIIQFLCDRKTSVGYITDNVYNYYERPNGAMLSVDSIFSRKYLTNFDARILIYKYLKEKGYCNEIIADSIISIENVLSNIRRKIKKSKRMHPKAWFYIYYTLIRHALLFKVVGVTLKRKLVTTCNCQ